MGLLICHYEQWIPRQYVTRSTLIRAIYIYLQTLPSADHVTMLRHDDVTWYLTISNRCNNRLFTVRRREFVEIDNNLRGELNYWGQRFRGFVVLFWSGEARIERVIIGQPWRADKTDTRRRLRVGSTVKSVTQHSACESRINGKFLAMFANLKPYKRQGYILVSRTSFLLKYV